MVCLHVCGNMPDRTFERWPRVRPAGSPFGFCFTSIFCLWYFMLETEVRLCSLCPGDLMCGIRHISPKLKQSSQMKFDHCCFTSRCALIRVLLFYGECPHLISDSTEVLGLIPSQVFTVEFACSPHDSWIPLGSPVLGGQKNPPPIRISSDKQKMALVSLDLEKSRTKAVFASLDVNAAQTLHTNINPVVEMEYFREGWKGRSYADRIPTVLHSRNTWVSPRTSCGTHGRARQ